MVGWTPVSAPELNSLYGGGRERSDIDGVGRLGVLCAGLGFGAMGPSGMDRTR